MYNVIKNVILSGRFELTEMLRKIDTVWFQGSISDEEKYELIEMAQEKATPENSYASIEKRINKAFEEIDALKEICKKLTNDDKEEVPDEYPEYVSPLGSHDAYKKGDKITFNNTRYLCVAPEDISVVWPPNVMPIYWEQVIKED